MLTIRQLSVPWDCTKYDKGYIRRQEYLPGFRKQVQSAYIFRRFPFRCSKRTNRPRKWSKPAGRSIETSSTIFQCLSSSEVNWRNVKCIKGQDFWNNVSIIRTWINAIPCLCLFYLSDVLSLLLNRSSIHAKGKIKTLLWITLKPGSPALLLLNKNYILNLFQMSPLLNIIFEQMVGVTFKIFQSYL